MTTSYTEIEQLFESRKSNPQYNTSYPLSPDDWVKYAVSGELLFDADKPIAFYVHIPFCKQICSFCEYTRICLPPVDEQKYYVKNLISDIRSFIHYHPGLLLYGFDIGGGTPTALCDEAFLILLEEFSEILRSLDVTADFEPSIEATFQTLTDAKITAIAKAGISRISLGIQSTVETVLKPLQRQIVNVESMLLKIKKIHEAKIRKLNLDLMYGLPGQTIQTISHDLETLSILSPEQVTVYELRINQLGNRFTIDSERCFRQYCELYNGLIRLGYNGRFGQNTFSKDDADNGLSSYLRHRMFDGWQYKGFGISAQSMSRHGLSYNKGKNSVHVKTIIQSLTYEAGQYYNLPAREILSKFIAISGYSGGISLNAARCLTGIDLRNAFTRTIQFLLTKGLVTLHDDKLQLTTSGFHHYGAVLSMFYNTQPL